MRTYWTVGKNGVLLLGLRKSSFHAIRCFQKNRGNFEFREASLSFFGKACELGIRIWAANQDEQRFGIRTSDRGSNWAGIAHMMVGNPDSNWDFQVWFTLWNRDLSSSLCVLDCLSVREASLNAVYWNHCKSAILAFERLSILNFDLSNKFCMLLSNLFGILLNKQEKPNSLKAF